MRISERELTTLSDSHTVEEERMSVFANIAKSFSDRLIILLAVPGKAMLNASTGKGRGVVASGALAALAGAGGLGSYNTWGGDIKCGGGGY